MIVILDYEVGNVASIRNMLSSLGVKSILSREKKDLESALGIILPGVGSFDAAMHALQSFDLVGCLNELVLGKKIPLLGICLGMQLLARSSEEGTLPGLGWVDATVKKFRISPGLSFAPKIPHMGWNKVEWSEESLFSTTQENRFYFSHSYHFETEEKNRVIGRCHYISPFVAAFRKDNVYGVQFHPEKSHSFGKTVLRNFAGLACQR